MAKKSSVRALKTPPGLDAVAKKEFKRVKQELLSLNILEIDQPALLAYLYHYSLWIQAKEALERDGLTILTPKGFTQTNPMHSILKQNSELMKKWVQELGFSPSSRRKLGIDTALATADDDELFED